ncbi:MAG TPA: GAF domain-containing sensor histidine kinase [Nitrospira sp.]|jgi:signal transduction histidine kinase|nr:GAF domain-containing sensor histidine kinase [Nitrospira sp.]
MVELGLAQGSRELETALRISRALSLHTTFEDLVAQTLDTALEAVDAECGSILIADPATQHLVNYHCVGANPVQRGAAIPWHHGIAGAVFRSAKHAVIVDAQNDLLIPDKIDKATGSVIKNMVILPLKRWQGEPIGVIEILNKRHEPFTEEDIAVVTMISSLATPVIEEARLFEAKKLAQVAKLAGDMSHDIKNLLMPVLCGAEVLKDELDELFGRLPDRDSVQSEKSRALCHEVLQMVQEDVRRISDRVRELADCVKGMSAAPKFTPCQVANVVLSVFGTLDLVAKKRGVSLSCEGLDGLPPIEADEQRLFNAFYNLVNNAIPEVSSGGSVTVVGKVHPNSDMLEILVADTGRGMPPEVRDSLFSAHAVSRKPGGTGLGTKIIKDVVDAHKGHIDVESVVGKGTTFRLMLPLRQHQTSRSKDSAAA